MHLNILRFFQQSFSSLLPRSRLSSPTQKRFSCNSITSSYSLSRYMTLLCFQILWFYGTSSCSETIWRHCTFLSSVFLLTDDVAELRFVLIFLFTSLFKAYDGSMSFSPLLVSVSLFISSATDISQFWFVQKLLTTMLDAENFGSILKVCNQAQFLILFCRSWFFKLPCG